MFFYVTVYTGNYVYKNGALQYFSTPEGYATPNGTGYRYVYNYKDHLGNTRLSYTKNDAGTPEIVEESNYYPFGLTHKGYNSSVSSLGNSTAQLLKFGGKEQQDELGLNTYDFGARFYDPAVGRWFTPDALAEKYYSTSPYTYALNNPVIYIDPDGNAVEMCCEGLQGFLAGMVDNTFGTNLRSRGNTQAFRNGVSTANGTSLAISTILLVDGAGSTVAGTGGLVASGAVASTGVGAPVGGIGAAASGGLLAKGAAELTVGGIIMSNTISNMKADTENGNGSSSSNNKNSESSTSKKIEDLKESSTPGDDTKGKTTNFDRKGGMDDANKVFDDLNPTDVKDIPNGRRGVLDNGNKINVRSNSSDKRPTVEIQDGKKKTKFRFGEKQ
ncbi:RHS repeat-associated core domain-containing protein [Aquimarina aquimarini]|uniref:RHS repeat-associated core domain-containing protein n=1 Tax=Aquimarina aquimarini TaxID=1191734 RepID=UPI001F31BFD8|nr:RHS repeat-associated core domain-containing protein [Aquimarina aquimarini]